MIVNQDIRGMQAWATMSFIPSNKNPMGNMLPHSNPIKEMKKTPFKGLTTDMRGRDLQGYAVVKSFNETQKKNDIMSSRLANPNPKFEMYPQPKKNIFKSSLDIKPSELDMLTNLKNDNAKMLIIQILKSKSIGIEHLQGNPGQRVRLLKAYNDLCAKYEIEYTKNKPGAAFLLQEFDNQFKREVQDIYGIPYDDLNKPADTTQAVQQILREIRDNTAELNNIFAAPATIGDIADQKQINLIPDDDEDIGELTRNPMYDPDNMSERDTLLNEIGKYVDMIEQTIQSTGIQTNNEKMNDYIIPLMIDTYNNMDLEPRIPPNISIANFEKLIRTGNITVLQQLIPVVEYLSRQPPPTEDEFLRGYIDSGAEDDGKDDKHEEHFKNKLIDILTVLHMIYPDAKENEIIENVRNTVKQYPTQKQIPDNIDDINKLSKYIMTNYNLDDLDDLKRDVDDLIRAEERPPSYDRDMGRDALAPVGDKPDKKDDGDLDMIIQRDIEKLQVKVGGSENKVIQLLRAKTSTLPADIVDLEDFYLYAYGLTLKSKKKLISYINELNAEDLSGRGRKKRTQAKRKTIRGKGLSIKDLRARLKLIMN